MNLSVVELHIIIDALEHKLTDLENKQALLDDAQANRIAELSNDIYTLELLTGSLQDEYAKHIRQQEDEARTYLQKMSEEQSIQDEHTINLKIAVG